MIEFMINYMDFGVGSFIMLALTIVGMVMSQQERKKDREIAGRPKAALDKEHEKMLGQQSDFNQLSLDMSKQERQTKYKDELHGIEAAGMSPSLLSSMGGIGGSAEGMQAATGQGDVANSLGLGLGDGLSSMREQAEIELLRAQADKTKTEEKKIGGDTKVVEASYLKVLQDIENAELQGKGTALDNTFKEINNRIAGATEIDEINKTRLDLERSKEELNKLLQEINSQKIESERKKEIHAQLVERHQKDMLNADIELLIKEEELKGKFNENELHSLRESILATSEEINKLSLDKDKDLKERVDYVHNKLMEYYKMKPKNILERTQKNLNISLMHNWLKGAQGGGGQGVTTLPGI